MAGAKHISQSVIDAATDNNFWSHVGRANDTGCRLWGGRLNGKGYGLFKAAGQYHMAHRLAFALGKRTPLPGVVMVCHRCDTPACCEPQHLFLGLAADNNADRAAKGRTVAPMSLQNGNSKLSDAQVEDVRSSAESGVAIARRFGVSPALVSMIRSGQRRQMVGDAGIEPATFRV